MGEYTFLLLNADRYATRYLTVDCLDDEGAMVLGRAIGSRHNVEVWHHARFVGEVGAAHPQEPEFGLPIDIAPTPVHARGTVLEAASRG